MMKRMRSNQDGYVLAYVLVVVTVLSLIAVGVCTNSLRNNRNQKATLEYTQDKYVAEGMVELFAAELQEGALESVKPGGAGISEFTNNDVEKIYLAGIKSNSGQDESEGPGDEPQQAENEEQVSIVYPEIHNKLMSLIGGTDGIKDKCEKVTGADCRVESTNLLADKDKDNNYFRFYYEIDVSAEYGSAYVQTEVVLNFFLKSNGATIVDNIVYNINDISLEFISYNVSTATGGEEQ